MLRYPRPLALLIGLLTQILFLFRVSVPHQPVFDETHYLPAARALLALEGPANTEHPLLGKALIAIGIAIFGDTPLGWRVAATIAGTAIVLGVFAILQQLFRRLRTSVLGAILVLLNFTVYVQARIAMLDGFLAAFVVTGTASLIWALQRGGWARWLLSAALFGCAIGCKWAAVPYLAMAGAAFFWLKLRDARRFPGIPPVTGLAMFGGVAVAVYALTFAPAFFYAREPMTLAGLLPFQAEMYARQTQILPPHTYQSAWWTWPFDYRPVWYLYERADGAQRGIIMIGNPVILWGGLVAVAACLWGARSDRSGRLLAVAGLWIAAYLPYAVIPKSIGFFYYYYVPSIALCIVIAAAFDHWRDRIGVWDERFTLLAFGMFVYFLPVLSAQALASPGAFRNWTWFASWV